MSIFLIILFLAIPALSYIKNWHKFLTLWIVQGIFLDILSVQWHGNFSAFKLAGIALAPFLLKDLFGLIKTRFGKLMSAELLWLYFSFVIFAFILPWENTTAFSRTSISYMNGLKQLFTHTGEFFLVLYLAKQFSSSEMRSWGFKVLIGSGLVCFAGLVLEKLFRFDFFHFFTSGPQMLIENRMRGFTFEPRAASQYMAYLFLIALSYSKLKWWQSFLLGLISLVGLVLTNSMSGTILLGAGVPLLILAMLVFRHQRLLPNLGILAVLGLLGAAFLLSSGSKDYRRHIKSRSYVFTQDSFVSKFEHADAAAVNFLVNNPKYLVTGSGTGQASIASTPYALPKSKRFKDGFTYLPFMGITLSLMNGGLILLFLQVAKIGVGLKEVFTWKGDERERKDLICMALLFTILYFLQVRYIHVFGLALMLGVIFQKNLSGEKSGAQVE